MIQADVYSLQGRRPYNEDRFIAIDTPYLLFRGIFDGHGGSEAVDYITANFARYIDKFLRGPSLYIKENSGNLFIDAVSSMILELDHELCRVMGYATVGSTACMVFIVDEVVVVANVGDSRAFISYKPFYNPETAQDEYQLWASRDHKPEEERSRINIAGGFVHDNRVNGILATSRALGDGALKIGKNGYSGIDGPVSALPDYYISNIRALEGTILLVASDGFFDVFNNDELVIKLRTPAATFSPLDARRLVDEAYGRGSCDNITVALINF